MSQLQLVLKWEQDKEQELIKQYRLAQQELEQQKQKLVSLDSYKLDYLRMIRQSGQQGGLGAGSYHQHVEFVGQLDKAVEQQTHAISRAKIVADQRKAQWLKQRQRIKAVETVLTKQQDEANRLANIREQKLFDEFASQRYLRSLK